MQLLVYTTIGLYTTIGRYDFCLQHYWSIRLLELVYMIICLYDNLSHFVNFFLFCQKKWQRYKNGIKTFATENTFQWRRDILEKCPIWPLLVKISCSCEVDMTEGEYICRHGLGLAKSEPSDYFVIITQICSYSIDTVSRKFAILLVFFTHQKSYQVSFLRSTIINMCF